MQRFQITVAYDGTQYCGWQIQPNGITIQAKLEGALAQLADDAAIKVHGSGRTDQGVHARAQVAHFDFMKPFSPAALQRALNALLPDDIRILRVRKTAPDFHARKSAIGKEYRYFVRNASVMPPTKRLYALHVDQPLDVGAMQTAAAVLTGRHDFAAFTANPNRVVDNTVRTLFALTVRKRGSDVVVIARGDGFLYKMVRSLTGWLLRVGKGDVTPNDTQRILDSRERTARVPTAQPHGLFLWRVEYP